MDATPQANKTRVLILGGGFGGCHAALHLNRSIRDDQSIEVTLVSREKRWPSEPLRPLSFTKTKETKTENQV
jgi:NADH dehydrogenase FAD-containing subunit